MTMKDETASFAMRHQSHGSSGALKEKTGLEAGLASQEPEVIVVNDRFLTGSGEFVDASMLRASSSAIELQDSEMVVYDDGGEDDPASSQQQSSDKRKDAKGAVSQKSPKK